MKKTGWRVRAHKPVFVLLRSFSDSFPCWSAWVSSRPAAAAAATGVFVVAAVAASPQPRDQLGADGSSHGLVQRDRGDRSSRRSSRLPSSGGRQTPTRRRRVVVHGGGAPHPRHARRRSGGEEEDAPSPATTAASARAVPSPRAAVAPLFFVRFDPDSVPVAQPLDDEQIEMLERHNTPGHFKRLAWDRQLVTECLEHYNSMHPGDEYEPAPGKVSRHPHFHNGMCWTHGNFVARKKRSGCFSFLPAPRTLFFFELAYRDGSNGVVTCTALDEPVTQAYSVLGFPLWCSPRRTGIFDSICKTCCRRFDVPHPGIRKTFACGHNNVEKICEMCYCRFHVLHPGPGEFAFGYHHPYHPYHTKH